MNRKIGIVGLGYVGLPVAVAFGLRESVVGFDINQKRIESLQRNIDSTGEINYEDLKNTNIEFTTNSAKLSDCNFIIVAVPTPIDAARQPDLTPLQKASETVGKHLKAGTIVVFESTVYPGATEEVCLPILERFSGLQAGTDFFLGYSPERINPGDREHTFTKIVKVVAGQDENTTSIIADVYGSVVEAGVYRASSIKVAEAAKVIENTQRDLNIALMNELAIIFDRLNIDTSEVLKASGTKWNFLKFSPGLVGGHCIGVDPYYLTHKAESVGYHPEIILAGRRINDNMGQFIATSLVKQMILAGIPIQGSKVAVLGITFKENVPDIRNSKVIDIIKELQEFGIVVEVSDPIAEPTEVFDEYGVQLIPLNKLENFDAVVLAVPHEEFVCEGWNIVNPIVNLSNRVVIVDVKSVLDVQAKPNNANLWRL
ncbi:nucleotide sugar dehydrogenase [Paenibacillus sp. YYML68]|uniref:nucleotide sugar dehydrogenase n=1 Tax=Paenibacillus sp. YYML68 TaxID=2909250 RepID=UPI002492D754|nr:nucleotide sugar dehydrogenase [Paenibacillus sp. YYML68]